MTRKLLLYSTVFYLALCATCYACRAEVTDEQLDRSFYEGLSCESLNRVSLRMAMHVVQDRRAGKVPDRTELFRVLRAMKTKGCKLTDPFTGKAE